MPNKTGPNTYRGYISPNTAGHSKPYRRMVRRVYGNCRVDNPGEDRANKAKCAAIAHTVAKRLYKW